MLTNKKLVASSSALTLTILGMVLFNGCTPPGPRAVLDGARLLREGHPDEAVPRLQEGVRLLPKNAQAWNYLGLGYHHAGRPQEAARAYQQALVLDRNLSVARFNLGCLYLDQANTPGAITELTTFTTLQPNSSSGWTKLGTAQWRSRQLDAAERSFSQALKLDSGSPEAMNGLGLVLAQRRRYAEALGHFTAALRVQTNYAPALLNAGIVLHQNLNNRPAALQKYREYLALRPAPANSAGVREIADQLESSMRPPAGPSAPIPSSSLAAAPQRAEALAVPTKPQPAPITNRSDIASPTRASSNVATSTSVSPTNLAVTSSPPANAALTNPVAAKHDSAPTVPSQKSVELVQVPRDDPIGPARELPAGTSNRTATPEVGTPKTDLFPPATASPAVSKSVADSSPTPAAKPKQKPGLITKLNPVNWFRSKDRDENPPSTSVGGSTTPVTPARTVAKSSETSPGFVERTGTDVVSNQVPRYRYNSVSARPPGNRPEAERRLADGIKARERNRLKEAVEAFRKATTADPSFFEAHYDLGVAAFEAGDYPTALLAYDQALSINADSMKARYNFAVALEKAGYLKDAANELERVVAKYPAEPAAYLALANLYAGQAAETGKARQHYMRFLELQPQSPQATAIRYWLEAHP